MDSAFSWVWNGRRMHKLDDFLDAMGMILTLPDDLAKTAATAFVVQYRAALMADAKDPQTADKNIGYLTGYLGGHDMDRARFLFGVSHPIFGDTPSDNITADDAMRLGMEWAQRNMTNGGDT